RRQERQARIVQELVRAVAEDQVVGLHAPMPRQVLAEREARGVRVEADALRRLLHRRHRQRRWPERVLIGGQLDDVPNAILALGLLDRLPRNVWLQLQDIRTGE